MFDSFLRRLASCESGETGEMGERVVEGGLGGFEDAVEGAYR